MQNIQPILSRVRQAAEKYSMLKSGDRVAVGVSGGKDSLVLLRALAALKRFDSFDFSVTAVTVDPRFEDAEGGRALESGLISEYCKAIGVEHNVIKSDIAAIVFRERQEKNPCSLCAHMRRGALSEGAVSLGCNVLALGHHMDDAAETYIMNIFRAGRAGCFSPVTEYADKSLRVIRPLIYLREHEIASFAKHNDIPVSAKCCPADSAAASERQHIKELLRCEDTRCRGIYRRILGALERSGVDGWHE